MENDPSEETTTVRGVVSWYMYSLESSSNECEVNFKERMNGSSKKKYSNLKVGYWSPFQGKYEQFIEKKVFK